MAIPESVRLAVVEEYVKFDQPADRLTTNAAWAKQFTDHVNSHLAKAEQMSTDRCMEVVLTLRRRGEMNGGLPRLRNGHGPSKGGPKNGYGPLKPSPTPPLQKGGNSPGNKNPNKP